MSKYHRGDKFVIEIAEKHTHYDDKNQPFALYRIKGFRSLVLDEYGLDRLKQENELDRLIEESDKQIFTATLKNNS